MSKAKNRGFSDDHVAFLTDHAQQFHGPVDFDQEVQKHLDAIAAEKVQSGGIPDDWSTEQSSFDQNRQRQADAISSIAKNAPPGIHGPALTPKTPDAAADTLAKAPSPQGQQGLDATASTTSGAPAVPTPKETSPAKTPPWSDLGS